MSIELDDIGSGYNLSKINNNFQKIESQWDEKLDRQTSVSNQMETELDMNGNNILNLPAPTAPTNPVRLQDLDGVFDQEGALIITGREEAVTLSAGQTAVTFPTYTTTSAAFYIIPVGDDNPRGRLLVGTDYTVTSDTSISLSTSYEAGTQVVLVQNEAIGDLETSVDSQIDSRVPLLTDLVFSTVADMIAGTTVGGVSVTLTAGDVCTVNERIAGGGGGARWLAVLTSTVTPNTYDIVQSTATPTISLKLIVDDKTTLPAFGVVMDGSVESSEALRVSLNYNVKPTEGTVWIDPVTPIVIDDDKNTAFLGLAKGVMRFQTTIDDGSRLFEYHGQFQSALNFTIGGLNGDSKNFTGMVMGNQTDATSFVRSQLDAKGTFCTGTAFEMRGFLNEVNLLTKNCGRGFKGRELNANTMVLRSEDDERGFDIEEIFGTNIEQLTLERVTQQVGTNPSRIDQFIGLNIDALYTEGSGWTTTPLEFGQSVGGKSVNINAGNITGLTDDDTPMVRFVSCDSVTANLDVSTGANPLAVDITENVKHCDSKIVGTFSTPEASRNKQFTQDNSKSVQVHANYAGDTYLDHGLATFPTISQSNCVISEETSILRNGEKGVRVTANAGTHLAVGVLQRQANHFEAIQGLAGKTVRAFAWVWVPDLPLFADRTIQPAFAVTVAGSSSSFPTAQRALTAGQWNLVESEDLTIPGGWGSVGTDTISFDFYVGNATETYPDGSYFIVVDSIFLTDTNCDIRDIMQGRYRESARYSGIKTDGDRLEIHSQTYHSLTASHVNVGQGEVYVYRKLPSASGKIGYVCTTGGTLGGTAVFKAFGAIDA